ncbi:cycloisomerase [Tropicimonas sp. IMCC34043]|uniref:cycloisomerase n=1 Tax=Tropicimonas sp. IMCC34043 TaxID=2248760 RepID=UPI000E288FEA|nr:cycloisomerase [Tropicimonas sp. IMCC34043]
MRTLLLSMGLAAMAFTAAADPDRIESRLAAEFDIPAANQGVGVDGDYFYAVNNHTITKHDKQTGAEVARWDGGKGGAIRHLDGAALIEGKLYGAQSNYPEWPMTSSIEVWNPETMEHVDSYSFGINYGSLTWLDRHDDAWWATFANYNRVFGRSAEAYGNKYNTMLVKLDDDFRFVEGWVFPEAIIDTFGDMSNSGGSWGPDGTLYITGHDEPEIYALRFPEAGSEMVWVGTIGLTNTGQGFAWDRTADLPTVYAIIRDKKNGNKVTVNVVEGLNAASWNQ